MPCWNSADLCAVRFSLLDTDGSPLCGEPDGTAYTMTPISLQVTPTVDAGETVTTRTGCGDICYTRTDPDIDTGADLVLTLCNLDPELIALATGAEVLAVNGQPGYAKGLTAGAPVEAHFWTKSLDGSAVNPSPNNWWHWVYPNVRWSLGNKTLGRDSLQVVLNGTAGPSTAIGNGVFGDVPTTQDPFYEAVWTADDIPDPAAPPYNQFNLACGFIDSPSCDSSSSE